NEEPRMTKTWSAVLAVALGLNGALLHAAQPPAFKDLPRNEIKLDPSPPDTKAPPAPTPAPAPGPATPSCTPACQPSGGCGVLTGLHLHLGQRYRCRDHEHLAKLWAWATYRPCNLSHPSCCGRLLPVPEGYEFFLHPGCTEGPGGSCCRTSCCNSSCNS